MDTNESGSTDEVSAGTSARSFAREQAVRWLDNHTPAGADLRATCVWLLARRSLHGSASDNEHVLGARVQNAQPDPLDRLTSALAVDALHCLDRRPAFELRVAEGLHEAGVDSWLQSLDWSNAALAAEDVMASAVCLVHQAEVEDKELAYWAYHRVLDGLATAQDSRTGLFGFASGDAPWRSVVATGLIASLYAYPYRPILRVARIVDSVLSLEQSDDGLARTRGSAREALAAVRLLTLVARQSTYRSTDIKNALTRTRRALAEMRTSDGSFPADADSPDSRLFRAGDDAVTRAVVTLWLRSLTLSAIDTATGDVHGAVSSKAHVWPGMSYQATGPLTAHERAILPRWIRGTSADPGVTAQSTPAISVVVPCFNLGVYLHGAVESVLNQSSQDFEIVVVDDGSTDEYTRLLLDHFRRPKTRIIQQENCGLPVARNEGIRQSRGRYVCCLDPDDRLHPGFFARAIEILDVNPDIGLVSGHFQMFDEHDQVFHVESCDFPVLLARNPVIEPAVFRRAGWERIGGYCTTFSSSGIEDWDLWISLLELGYKPAIVPETIWEYRVRSDQMSTGMYQPERWRRLVHELVLRHAATFARHVSAVIEEHAGRWAELRSFSQELRTAVGWWERQSGNWERASRSCDGIVREQQARIDELERQLRDLRQTDREPDGPLKGTGTGD
jgi:glycosyltransferase involved in cell wall biosynthesis